MSGPSNPGTPTTASVEDRIDQVANGLQRLLLLHARLRRITDAVSPIVTLAQAGKDGGIGSGGALPTPPLGLQARITVQAVELFEQCDAIESTLAILERALLSDRTRPEAIDGAANASTQSFAGQQQMPARGYR